MRYYSLVVVALEHAHATGRVGKGLARYPSQCCFQGADGAKSLIPANFAEIIVDCLPGMPLRQFAQDKGQ